MSSSRAARRVAKKRAGLPIPASACTRCAGHRHQRSSIPGTAHRAQHRTLELHARAEAGPAARPRAFPRRSAPPRVARAARAGSSRNGPAGSSAPFPQPRMASTSTISASRASARVLQAVIGDHDPRAVGERRLRRPDPVAAHVHGALGAPADQQRLIAHVLGAAAGVDAQDVIGHTPAVAAPVAARDHRRLADPARAAARPAR